MRCLKLGLQLVALMLWSLTACADPAEDYDAGARAYARGDVVTAMKKLKPIADSGHAGAQAILAIILDAAEFDDESVRYYRMSAEQGNADGQYGLGLMYAKGEGVVQNPEEARKWVTLAAVQGQEDAVATLASAYIEGGFGLDEEARLGPDALPWIRRAADNNFPPAMTALAAAYRSGQYGLKPDTAMADSLDAKVKNLRDVANAKTKPSKAKPSK